MAEGVGFEPTDPCRSPVFKTGALNRSAIPPKRTALIGNREVCHRRDGSQREAQTPFFQTEEEVLIFCTDCVLGSLPLKTLGKIKRALEQIALSAHLWEPSSETLSALVVIGQNELVWTLRILKPIKMGNHSI
jgi:hypothetical protein